MTTHWSVVVAASRPDALCHDQALAALCQAYWGPVYSYIRRRGNPPEDSQDLTQEFFARMLAKEWLAGIEPCTSRFRSFLLTAVSRFLANEYDRTQTAKRGGKTVTMSLDEAEWTFHDQLTPTDAPETEFDRRWAVAVMDRALRRLREETTSNGKSGQFDRLSVFLSREPDEGEYPSLAAQTGVSQGAIGVAVHRLRHRYRDLVRAEIADTLGDPRHVDEEMRHLIAALRSDTM